MVVVNAVTGWKMIEFINFLQFFYLFEMDLFVGERPLVVHITQIAFSAREIILAQGKTILHYDRMFICTKELKKHLCIVFSSLLFIIVIWYAD